MKIHVMGKDAGNAKACFKKHFSISQFKPDLIVVFGGHGTLFKSEKKFPGIPKLFIRHKIPDTKMVDEISNKLKERHYETIEMPILNAKIGKKSIRAFNDISIHCKHPQAIRFQIFKNNNPLFVDEKGKAKTIIGDGVVIATPYGSNAYFKSITKHKFDQGIGIAPNNPMDELNHVVVDEKDNITIKIVRGPGFMFYDSAKKGISLDSDKIVQIKKGEKSAKLIQLK